MSMRDAPLVYECVRDTVRFCAKARVRVLHTWSFALRQPLEALLVYLALYAPQRARACMCVCRSI
jgi:hypothetical protein